MSSTDFARTNVVSPPVPGPALGVSPALVDRLSSPETTGMRWSLPTRLGFRFFAAYFLLYVLCTQMFGALFGRLLALLPFQTVPPMLWQSVQKFQAHITVNWLHYPQPLSLNRGAGDKPLDWALALGLLVIAVGITAIWSAVDWKRPSYPRLHAWFRLFLRLSVATSIAGYGWAKAFPSQMPFPSLTRMLEPYGHFSLMAVLWSKIGSSTPYEIFTGIAELTAAVLLLIPGLSTVGALIAIPVTFQVWMLNMTYDVPVKLFSLHLLAMSMALLVPDARRLVHFLVLKRATDPPHEGRLFRNLMAHRVTLALQVVFAVWFIWGGYQQGKAGSARLSAPKPPLYGIYNIDRMMINGVERAPLLTDYDRWRRLVIQTPMGLSFQRMNDTWQPYSAQTDMAAKVIVITTPVPFQAPGAPAGPPPKEIGRLAIDRPGPDRLILDGAIAGRRLRLEMSYVDPAKLRLMSATFQWVQDRPWNISNADYIAPALR